MAAYSGSARTHDAVLMRNVMVPMRDGIRLATNLYLPAKGREPARGPFSAVVERTPYGKSRAALHRTGLFFAQHGYVCAIQDVRGRYDSEGQFDLCHLRSRDEAQDGYDTIEWLAMQPWSSGKVGTFGGSYTGQNQQAAALLNPPSLTSQFIRDCALNNWRNPVRKNGAFNQVILLRLAYRMAKDGEEAKDDPALAAFLEQEFRSIGKYLDSFPLKRGTTSLARSPSWERWYFDVATRADFDEFWDDLSSNQETRLEDWKDVPVCFVTGWYGHHLQQNFEKFMQLSDSHLSPTRLVVGPWLHGSMLESTSAGRAEFGSEAYLDDMDRYRLRWFDETLKGLDTGILDGDPITFFTMGGGSGGRNSEGRLQHGGFWRTTRTWPPLDSHAAAYYLHQGGTLSENAPSEESASTTFLFDPSSPVPTIGGNFHGSNAAFHGVTVAGEGGAADQRGDPSLAYCRDDLPLSTRHDVLVFQTKPLAEDVEISGEVSARLWVSSSAPDTDFTLKLIDVYPPSDDFPEGFAMNLQDTIVRMRYRNGRQKAELIEPGEAYELRISVDSTSNLFRRGHCIRVDVSSSNFPAFDVNPNTGGPLGVPGLMRTAENTVFHDAGRPSHVLLPIRRPVDKAERPQANGPS